MKLRQRKSAEDRQEEIIEQTLRLAGEVGPDRTTAAAVAQAVGVTHAAVFRHFPTMSDLWLGVARWLGIRMLTLWDKAARSSNDPVERIRALTGGQLRLIKSTPAVPALLFSRELHSGNEALRRMLSDLVVHLQNHLAEAVRDGQRQGLFRAEADPEEEAFLILSVIQGATVRWMVNSRSFDLLGQGRRMVELALRGLLITPPKEDAGRE